MSSCEVRLMDVFLLGPGGCLVVGGAGLEAAVEDADEAVGELAGGGGVLGAAVAFGVVGGAGAGRGGPGAPGLGRARVGEAPGGGGAGGAGPLSAPARACWAVGG